MQFAIFRPYNTPTFKIKALYLVSNEEQSKTPFAAIQMDNTALS